jgi:hypothetical protein
VKPCPLCGGEEARVLYAARGLPLFQNKVYRAVTAARSVDTGDVALAQCNDCDFAFNASFEPEKMEYDASYQNEQCFSAVFSSYLAEVADLVMSAVGPDGAILEIGCGKGTFFDLLKGRGVTRIKGFDPIYQGDHPDIVRANFSAKNSTERADLIVLRHTLEHIEFPLQFLHLIAAANDYRGKIYIEVPDFDWIVRKSAFWDVFYEHCNYFVRETLESLFTGSTWHGLFRGQHQGIVANLADLVSKPTRQTTRRYLAFPDVGSELAGRIPAGDDVFVWGASSKGVTLCNLVDRGCERIKGLIDINPAKQGCYTPGSGHPIFPPGHLDRASGAHPITVVVTNPNYLQEIKSQIAHLATNVVTI